MDWKIDLGNRVGLWEGCEIESREMVEELILVVCVEMLVVWNKVVLIGDW